MENKVEEKMENKMQKNLEAENRYLEFSMGTQNFAVPILVVREVISVPETTEIPGAPPYFEGLMNLRGQIITIIDLRKKMNLQTKEENSEELEESVIVLNLGQYSFGIKVDIINRVSSFSKSAISPVPEMEFNISSDFIDGIYQKKEELIILLNLPKVLNLKDLNILQQQAA